MYINKKKALETKLETSCSENRFTFGSFSPKLEVLSLAFNNYYWKLLVYFQKKNTLETPEGAGF